MERKKFGIKRKRNLGIRKEKEYTKRSNIYRHKCSGALEHRKGDGQDEYFLYEIKSTEKKSFSLKQEILSKLEKERKHMGKRFAALVIRFCNTLLNKERDYVIIEDEVFKELYEAWKEKKRSLLE